MNIYVTLTPDLIAWLRASHDDGHRPLLVRDGGAGWVVVERASGSALSGSEAREIRALLAAHEVSPLGPRGR